MVAKYYVVIRPQLSENHSVHREGCPFLPDNNKRVYLGEFNSGQDAAIESKHLFARSKSCLFCCSDHKSIEKKPLKHDWSNENIIPSKPEITESYQSKLLYCLN
jgi:hypothetical protein